MDKDKKRIDRLIRANTTLQKNIEVLRDEIEVLKGNITPNLLEMAKEEAKRRRLAFDDLADLKEVLFEEGSQFIINKLNELKTK